MKSCYACGQFIVFKKIKGIGLCVHCYYLEIVNYLMQKIENSAYNEKSLMRNLVSLSEATSFVMDKLSQVLEMWQEQTVKQHSEEVTDLFREAKWNIKTARVSSKPKKKLSEKEQNELLQSAIPVVDKKNQKLLKMLLKGGEKNVKHRRKASSSRRSKRGVQKRTEKEDR